MRGYRSRSCWSSPCCSGRVHLKPCRNQRQHLSYFIYTVHGLNERIGAVGGVCVAEPGAYRLIDEQQIVSIGPGVIVKFDYYVELSFKLKRTNFLQVTYLWRWSWSSVEPQYCGVVLELWGTADIFLSIEEEGECGVVFSDLEVSTGHNAIIFIIFGEVELVAWCFDRDWISWLNLLEDRFGQFELFAGHFGGKQLLGGED